MGIYIHFVSYVMMINVRGNGMSYMIRSLTKKPVALHLLSHVFLSHFDFGPLHSVPFRELVYHAAYMVVLGYIFNFVGG